MSVLGECLEDKREDYQNCSVLYCGPQSAQLYTMSHKKRATLFLIITLVFLGRFLLSRVSILLLTCDIDIVILSICLSVRLSVRDTMVLYENGLTYRHSFSTIR